MPQRPNKPCLNRLCRTLTRNRSGYCDTCEPEHRTNWKSHQAKHGNRHKRGYGKQWEQLRKEAIELNRKRYFAKYMENPQSFRVESFPNMEGEPLQGFCVESFRKGMVRVGTHVDHILSKAKGGRDEIRNLQVLSKPAHQEKTARE